MPRLPIFAWRAPVFVLFLAVASCVGDVIDEASSVVFDTLPDGVVHVRNSGGGAWSMSPESRWHLREDLRIGRPDGDGPEVFGRIRSVVVDELDQIWVVDGLANEVRVFERDGTFVRTVGQRGSGPGEFMQIGPAFAGPDGEIWVEDLSLSRWERFDPSGVRVGGLPSTSRIRGAMRLWTHDGRFLVVDSRPTDPEDAVFVQYRLAGSDSLVAESTFAFPEVPTPDLIAGGAGGGMPAPFTPVPWMTVSPDGEVWVTHVLDGYMIRRQTLEGDTLLVLELLHDPVPVPDATRERAIADLDPRVTATAAFRPGEIPRAFPPYESFHVSADGRLWVHRRLEGGMPGFDVFEIDGQYLGQLPVAADLDSMRIQQITASHLYAVATDSLGIDSVVRLSVERGTTTLP